MISQLNDKAEGILGISFNETASVWQEWLDDGKKASVSDLTKLLENKDMLDPYKARALFLLLVPDLTLNPFGWIKTSYSNYFGFGEFDLGKYNLSDRVLLYVSDIVTTFYPNLKEDWKNAPSDSLTGILIAYNNYVVQLLGLLVAYSPVCKMPELKLKLFDILELNDIEPYTTEEGSSGYRPLADLLKNPLVELYIKEKAHMVMGDIILDEHAGKKAPRARHEDALVCYAGIISEIFGEYSISRSYDISLLVDQLQLIFAAAKHLNTPEYRSRLFPRPCVRGILATLASKDIKISVKFSKFVVGGRYFTIYDRKSLDAAEVMLRLLGEEGQKPHGARSLQEEVAKNKDKVLLKEKEAQTLVLKKIRIANKMTGMA